MSFFFQGLTIGLAYVAPIGIQNLFVINAALTYPRRRALLTALIVIFFDISLALACFFGVGAVMQRYQWLQMAVLLLGSVIVIYIGIGLLRKKPEDAKEPKAAESIRKTISSACVVTWLNPQAIVDGTMMLGAFFVTLPASQSGPFISGVVTASCLWFTGLTLLVSLLGSRLHGKVMVWINRICGGIIILYGLKLLANFVSLYLLGKGG